MLRGLHVHVYVPPLFSSSLSSSSLLLLPRASTRLFHSTRPLFDKAGHDLPWVTGTSPPKGFWDTKTNQKKYLDHLYKTHEFTTPDDWYKIKKSDFTGTTGKSFLAHFENSPADAIISVYGKSKFLPWKFGSVPTSFWDEGNNQRKYVEWLGKELGYSSMQDWYKVGVDDFHKHGGRGLLAIYNNSIQNCLEFVFPEHDWLSWKFQKLPTGYWDDINNVRQYLNWMATDLKLQSMDEWLRVDGETLKKYDVVRVMAKYGTLRKVLTAAYPSHSWANKPKALSPSPPSPSTASSSPSSSPVSVPHARPASSSVTPAPRTPPPTKSSHPASPSPAAKPIPPLIPLQESAARIVEELPNIDTEGEIAAFVYTWSESKFILESKWDSSHNPTNWWMLGNPGGIRVIWEAKPKKFYTQTGGVLTPPADFAKLLPRNVNLDGTLTCVDGRIHHCVNTHIRTHLGDWSGITFNIFDAPSGKAMAIEDRMAQIEALNLEPSENVNVIKLSRVQSMEHLLSTAKQMHKRGIDSILLRKPKSEYEKGKSELYKRALIYNLQPALVTSIAGPFIIRCSFTDGTDFALSHYLPDPPKVGSVVMVKFNKINEEGLPRNAALLGLAQDLQWDNIVGKKLPYNLMVGDKLCE